MINYFTKLLSGKLTVLIIILILNTLSQGGVCPGGDLNDDCTVDIQDLVLLCEQWLSISNCGDDPNCADFNQSGWVDLVDFAVAAENWQRRQPRLIISEFMASNQATIRDGHGDYPDWIELYNPTDESVTLDGWSLTNDIDDLTKWRFPDGVTILPGQYYLVFASGKTEQFFPENYPYADPSGYLHTNFNLASSGKYLALIRPDETVSCEYQPEYPPQYEDISYGKGGLSDVVFVEDVFVAEFCPATAVIPSDGSMELNWTDIVFDDSGWQSGTTGMGYDYSGLIGLDVGAMRYVHGSAYCRILFEVDDPSNYDSLTLKMKYDDGFIAYLNGLETVGANAPDDPNWNSTASVLHPDAEAVIFEDFDITDYKGALQVGTNVLAIHGLNVNPDSSDLLILPKLIAGGTEPTNTSALSEGYFSQPTPEGQNSEITINLGPRISDVTKNPPQPSESSNLIITAKITETVYPVGSVTMTWRINYGGETASAMNDTGAWPDSVAFDGTYTAVIPASAYEAGDMVRWYVGAEDTQGLPSRYPLFPDATGSDEYFGVMVQDPSVITAMPVLYWFLEPGTESAADTRDGTRASLFYNGEFHDNVFVRIRGGSITSLNKKSYKFEFNTSNHFRYDERFGRVDEININTTYTDKAYVRQSLSFETYDWAGLPAPESFLVRVQRNGGFFSVAAFIEQPDADMLEREGLDKQGALYKMYNAVTSSSAQKKTRLWENNDDLAALVSNIHNLSGQDRTNYIFDNINIPAVLNFLAASVLVQQDDDSKKNYYLYRDTNGSGEWMFLPWDLDLTYGKHWMADSSILSDVIWPDLDYIVIDGYPIWPSHPLVDTEQTPTNRSWNHLTDALLTTPEFVEMYLRRLRTLMDEILQATGTNPDGLRYENRIDAIAAQVGPDVVLDRQKWGWYGQTQTLTEAMNILKHDYLDLRRTHLYITHNVDNVGSYNIPNSFSAEIPNGQPESFPINFGNIDYNPSSTNQDEEYIELINPNSFAVDVSGWELTGGVEFTFEHGTVIRAGGNMYVSPNVTAFRSRSTSPTGGLGHFVQGNYKGHLSSWGETLTLLDKNMIVVNSIAYPGNPTDAQRYLRITEIMYHPAQGQEHNEEEYEFIELKNIGSAPLLLDNIKFTEGIAYTFEDGMNLELPAGGYVLLVKNPSAFESRYGSGYDIAGQYTGYLDNGGEKLKVEDATNSTILEFSYDDDWYEITDGTGFSLTVIDPNNPDRNSWDEKSGWRPGSIVNGSPGMDDEYSLPNPGDVVINELLAHSHAANPDWIELHNTTPETINIGGWFLSDDNDNLKKYEIPSGASISAGGYVVFYEDTSFGDPYANGCHVPFALSENGETLYLHSGQDGELTGYGEEEDFGPSQTNIAFGRYQKSTGTFNFVAMSANTAESANAYPKVGPIVISEIMYHPQTNGDAEYVELLNISGSTVNLWTYDLCTASDVPWRFTDEGGVTFDFPVGTTMAIDERILLVRNLAAFNGEFPGISGVQIFEWIDGRLNNSGEKIQLSMPGEADPQTAERYYIRVDRVVYSDGSNPVGDDPWPTAPDGEGKSLIRKTDSDYGNDVINWQAAIPAPGQ